MVSGVASAIDAPAQIQVQDKIPLMVVHSQPKVDARLEAAQLRMKDNRKYMSYFLHVTQWSDWKKIFGEWPLPYPWPHMSNEAYSKQVIYHLAAQNNGDVGYMAERFFREGRFGDPNNIDVAALNALTSSPTRVHEVFRPDEVAYHSEAFLLKVFEWHYLSTKLELEKRSAALNVPHAIISKSTGNSPMLRPAKHRKSKSQLSIEVPSNFNPHLMAVPSSAGPPPPPNLPYAGDSRRTTSAHTQMRPSIGIRGGDRAVSGPMFDAPTGPKTGPGTGQRPYMPPTPTMGRPPHPLSQQSTPGQMIHPQPAGYPRRDISTGTVVSHGIMAQFPPQPQPQQVMRMPSGEIRPVHPQIPGHTFGQHMPPHHVQHGAMGPPPPHSVGMSMSMHPSGLPMSPMQPICYDPNMARPMVEHGGMLYDPNQPNPAQNRQDFSRPQPRNQHANYGQYVENSRHSQNNRGRKQSRGGRGGGGGGRGGMQSYDGGRRQSVHAVDRASQGNMHDSMPPPPPVERAHRESFSNARPQETERFPDFHEQQESFNIDNIPRELRCLRKFIGSDVEDMDSLWIGNIPHGTSDQMIQSLIEGEVNVAVVGVKPVIFDANKAVGWTIVTFHKTSDARLVLQKLEEFSFRGHLLDVQVPERCRHDLSGYKVQSRRSSNKHSVVDGPIPGVPVGPRSSFSRNNSIRQLRTNSMAHSDGSGRRNSLFSPQDARSDIPVLPDLLEVTEAVKEEANEGSVVALSEVSVSTVMHATAAPFVPPQYNSFGAELSGPANKHLAVEEQFHRSASSESLRRTSEGYDYEFSFEPNDEALVEQAIEDDATTLSDSSHPFEAKKSSAHKKSKAVRNPENEAHVVESGDDAAITEDSKAKPETAQSLGAEDKEAIEESAVHLNEDPSTVLTEEMPVLVAEAPDVVEKPLLDAKDDEVFVPATDMPISAVKVPEEVQNFSTLCNDNPSAPLVKTLPVPASEADVESRAESVFSEGPTEILSDTAMDKAPESALRKSAVPAASIHPFAKPKSANAQRQVSKADKKKAKKQGQASKKKTEPVASVEPEAPEPEILSLDEIKAKSKAKDAPSKSIAAGKPGTHLTEANVKALSETVAEASAPMLGSEARLSPAEEKIVVPEVTKTEDIASCNTSTAPRVLVVPKTALPVAYPRNPFEMKRVPSVTLTADRPRKERKPSTTSVASDSSFGTPKTAKEYQTPVPSPAPDMSSSPSATLVAEIEEVVQATAGAEAELIVNTQPEVKIDVDAEAESTEFDKSASAQAAVQTNKKKNQKKKRQNRDTKKKTASVDAQDASQSQAETSPKGVFEKLMVLNPCTGMDQESSPNADKATSPGLHDDNATPLTSSVVTGRDEKSSVSKTVSTKTASHAVKENAGGPRSWASLLAGNGKPSTSASANVSVKSGLGLTQRDTNVGQQQNKGG
ncbi:hypothetical protein Vi05172_g3528 [Venturia inaequalis]|nr:hypothetical protein Vi05172_g3528 [Venturia inaequalis]